MSSSSDQLQEALSSYLEKRRISSSENPSSSCSLSEYALCEILSRETSDDSSLSGLFSRDSEGSLQTPSTETQYSKFKAWISESPDKVKSELAHLLYPLFTHSLLSLLSNHQILSFQKFYKKHKSTFLGNGEFSNFIKILGGLSSHEDVTRSSMLSSYLKSKTTVSLSSFTYDYLLKFMRTLGKNYSELFFLLRSRIDLRVTDPLSSSCKSEAFIRVGKDSPSSSSSSSTTSNTTLNNNNNNVETSQERNSMVFSELDKLKGVFESVRQGPLANPSVLLYTLQHSTSSFCSSSLSETGAFMGGGSDDSTIHLFDLETHSSSPRLHDDFNSRITLSLSQVPCPAFSFDSHRLLRSHSGPVYALSFLNNDEFLLSVSEDTTMRLWNTGSGSNRAIYRGHTYPIWCLDIDRLGVNVVTGSMDKTAKLWNLEYIHPLRIYAGHEKDVDSIAFHPNCNYVATGSVDKSLRLWSHADAKMVRIFTGHDSGIYSLAFSPNGKYLASAGDESSIRIWDLASSKCFQKLLGNSSFSSLSVLSWSSDSSTLFIGSSKEGGVGVISTYSLLNENGNKEEEEKESIMNLEIPSHRPQSVFLDLKYSRQNHLIATLTSSLS